jgi:geranylgeranyl pyrophosphate synthase
MTSTTAYLDGLRAVVNASLDRLFRDETAPPLIVDAMRYGLLGGGKRLRPCLTLAAAEAVALTRGDPLAHAQMRALPGACAVELVHSYSLVHDDLPAMDDDILRRGRPTSHVIYGDGLAILAGDGLLTEAFGLIARSPSVVAPPDAPSPSPDARLRAIAILASAAGCAGMVGGQAIDLAAAGRVPKHEHLPFDAASLRDMHARKTGALIRAAATIGAVALDADEITVAAIDEFARDLGLAFQIVDDILDVEGSNTELGKTPGKDAAAHKVTYPALYGLEPSRRLAADCIERAKAALTAASIIGRLADIADWTLARRG